MTKRQIIGAWILVFIIVVLNCFLTAKYLV